MKSASVNLSMLLRSILFLAGWLVLLSPASAAGAYGSVGWYAVTLTAVGSEDEGGQLLYLSVVPTRELQNLPANPRGCTDDMLVVRDPAIISSATAVALAALSAGMQLKVYITDSCDVESGRPLVIGVGMASP
jgi:hypothetical protein